ncbi:Slp family lipoprotein [Candidatus Nitrospira bockiana]
MSRLTFSLAGVVFFTACATSPPVIPEALESQIDRTVTFTEVLTAPGDYIGRLVAFGGEILNAKRTQEATVLEILQLPLDDWEPASDRAGSQGRFLALNRAFLDPATLPPKTRVTVVGEVTGSSVRALDGTDYTYPQVDVRHIHVWPDEPLMYGRPRPSWGISVGGGTVGRGVGLGGGIGIGF